MLPAARLRRSFPFLHGAIAAVSASLGTPSASALRTRTTTFPKGVKSLGAFSPSQRIAALVEHGNAAPADQKSPFATDAVVNSGFSVKQRTVAQRPDNKFVTKAPIALLRVGAISPKVHRRTVTAFFDPDGKAAQSKAK